MNRGSGSALGLQLKSKDFLIAISADYLVGAMPSAGTTLITKLEVFLSLHFQPLKFSNHVLLIRFLFGQMIYRSTLSAKLYISKWAIALTSKELAEGNDNCSWNKTKTIEFLNICLIFVMICNQGNFYLTHLPLVPHICISVFCQHRLR